VPHTGLEVADEHLPPAQFFGLGPRTKILTIVVLQSRKKYLAVL
jgi:hypothetical protein